MLVKCRVCGEKIDRDIAYKVTNGRINEYYCTKTEYLDKIRARELKENVYNKISDIFGYTVTSTAIYKEISSLEQVYGFHRIYEVLCYYQQQLDAIMSRPFDSEYGKIRYFSVVLQNKLKTYVPETKKENKLSDFDMPNMKYKRHSKRKTLAEIEMEVGEDN